MMDTETIDGHRCPRCGGTGIDRRGHDPAEDRVRDPLCRDAIDEIEALRARTAALLAAAKEAREACAALFRFAATTDRADVAMEMIADAGVRDGFGSRLQVAIEEADRG